MKRLHVHVSVDDLTQSIRFYSTLFAAEPTVVHDDYAKWMLDHPRVNFAISNRAGREAGFSHLGIQVEVDSELAEVYGRLARAEQPIVEAKNATCCYAKSDKQWIADPQGVPWETFFTYGESTIYGEGSLDRLREATEAAACCGPATGPDSKSRQMGYSDTELAAVPEGANLGLGCGNPRAIAALQPGEVV